MCVFLHIICVSVPRLSPLHHAALSGNKELISLLLEAQAAVDIKDHKGKKKQTNVQTSNPNRVNVHRVSLKHTVASHTHGRRDHSRKQTAKQIEISGVSPPCCPIVPSYAIEGRRDCLKCD